MGHSKEQRLASLYNQPGKNTYIRNKREKGQKRLFTCNCCSLEG